MMPLGVRRSSTQGRAHRSRASPCAGGGYSSRERFLTELTLDPPEATSDESGVPHRDEDYLILSTLHFAKGQKWPAVYLLNAVDGGMPSDIATGNAAEIEEERCLLYVGNDARSTAPSADRAAAFLRSPAAGFRRSPCVWFAHAFHTAGAGAAV